MSTGATFEELLSSCSQWIHSELGAFWLPGLGIKIYNSLMKLGQSEEALVGFDAREMWLTQEMRGTGPGGRPSEFLLRTDLDDVLSADTMVWPSIFKSTATPDRGPELPRPQWVGINVPFWDDLNALRIAVPPEFGRNHPFWLIAATWHTDVGFTKEEGQKGKILGPHIAPTTPEQREVGWRFLGFDITDSGVSGLSNCGYNEFERNTLRAQWGCHLNRYHLLEDLEPAFEFKRITHTRVPEYAPFFVIGLWLIAKSTPE